MYAIMQNESSNVADICSTYVGAGEVSIIQPASLSCLSLAEVVLVIAVFREEV